MVTEEGGSIIQGGRKSGLIGDRVELISLRQHW